MADKFTEDFLRAMNGKTTGVSTPAVSPSASGADNFTKQYLAAMGAGETAAKVQTPAAPYKLQTVLNPAVKAASVTAPKAASPQTTAPKTETAKQTTVAPKNATFWEKLGLYLSGSTDTTLPNVQANDSSELIAENLASGAVDSVKGVVNLLNYYGQGAMRGKTAGMEAQQKADAAITGSKGSAALADNFKQTREAQEAKGLTAAVDWGKGLKQDIAERSQTADKATLKIGEVANTVGGMVPSMVSNAVAPGSSLLVMGAGAAGNAIEQAKAEGASDAGALTYGTAVGLIEAATEKMFDGVFGVFGKGVADDAVENLVTKYVKSGTAQNAILTLTSMLGEGAEEFVAEVTENWMNRLTAKTDDRRGLDLLSDAGKSAAMGALVSALFQGAQVMQRGDKITAAQVADNAVAAIDGGGAAQNAQNPVQAPVIAQDGTQGGAAVTTQGGTETAQGATQAKPATYTANAPEPNTAQQGAAGEKAQPPQSKGIFPQGSLGAQLALTTQTQANNNPRTYDEAQKTIDDYTDTLIAKYGEDEALFVDPDTKFNYSTMKPSKMSDAEIGKLADMYKARDGIAENEKNTAINSIMNAIPSKDYKNEGWAASKNDIREALEEIYHNNELSNAFHGGAQTVDIANELYNILIRKTDVDAPRELWGNYDLAKSVSEDRLRYPFGQSPAPLLEQIDDIVNAMTNPGVSQASTAPAQKPAPMFLPDSLGAKLTSELPEGVGAAEKGFAGDYAAWQMDTAAKNFHPEGENPTRTVDLPKVNPQGESTMKTAATVMESANTPDTRVAQIEQYMADGNAAYVPVTDADANTAATASIEEKGWDKSLTDWTADVRSGKVSKQLVSEGAALLNNAANSVATAQQYLDIFNDYATLLHNAGQSLQAARLLKQLSPEGRLYGIQKSVESMVEEIKGGENIKLSDELVDKYRNAKTDAERDAVIAEMQDDVAKQIPSSAMDKWTALRYVNMLGNFKTQVRNVAGNTAMTLGAITKRRVNAALESVVSAVTGGKYQKTASFGWSPAIFRAALQDFQTVKSAAMGEGKYSDANATGEFMRGVNDKRTIFKNNGTWGTDEGNTALARSAAAKGLRSATNAANAVMEAYRRVTNSAMEGGDYVFSIVNYADALSSYLKAHGVKADAVKAAMNGNLTTSLEAAVSPELLDAARTYAIKEAQEATFRDTNAVSKWASQVGRGKNTPKFVKTIAEGTVPFRKTPANVLVRGVEYSPLGAFDTAVKAAQLAKGAENVTGADVINSLSKTMTGTGIFMVGYALAKAGLLRIKDDDDKKEAFDKLTGHQDYALELPNGHSLTLDWVSPSSMSLFTGAAWYQNMVKNGFQISDIEKTLTALADPMLEMSMVSGINDTLSNIKYSDNSLMQLVLSSTLNYLSQGLTNTLLGQVERTAETTRKTTYVGSDSTLPTWLDRSLGKASAKTPGWDYKQQDYINAWGNTQSSGTLGQRIFNNFFNPSYTSKVNETSVDKELTRLYELNGGGGVFPKTADKSITVNGQGYDLTGDEYSRYQQTYGQTAFKALDSLFKSAAYKAMSDEEKVKAVSGIYSAATVEAKRKIIEGRGEMYLPDSTAVKLVDSFAGAGLSKDKAYSLYKTLDALTPEQGKSSVSNQQKAKTVVQQGYSKTQTVALVGTLWDKTGADECKTLLPSLNVAQRLVTMYVDSGNSDLVNMTTPRTFSENSVTYELTDAEMTQFSKVYADYFNQRATNLMSEDTLIRIKKEAYNRAKYSVINGRK